MKPLLSTSLAYLAGLALVAGPVLLSIAVAERHSIHVESQRAMALADEVMRRTDETGRQVAHVIAVLASGARGKGFDLGSPDHVSEHGVAMRVAARLPVAPQSRFVISEAQGYAAIVHVDVILAAQGNATGISLAMLGASSGRPISARGAYDPAWLRPIARGTAMTFNTGRFLVALSRSKTFDLTAVAAIPVDAAGQLARELMAFLVPFGLIVGLALAAGCRFVVRHRRSLPSLLRAALRRDEFFLVYQPILRLDTRQCVGAEALLRWRRRDGSMVGPDLFIPVAEQSGIITNITRRILALIEREVPALVTAFPQLHVSVNLSSRDLQTADIVKRLTDLVHRSGITPGNLIVEATERGLIDVAVSTTIIDDIRTAGIGVAIDDFGTGYSCLSYLTTLHVDYLKIDKSFVDTIGTTARTNSVVLHIIEMAKSLNLAMIAEGVESEAQAAFLRERGVQFAQGFLYAKPMSHADFTLYMLAEAAERHNALAELAAMNTAPPSPLDADHYA